LEHYKRFQKSKQAKQKKLMGAIKEVASSKAKDEKTTSEEDHPRSGPNSKAYERKLARQNQDDETWLGEGQWRKDILHGRQKKGQEELSVEKRQHTNKEELGDEKLAVEGERVSEIPE
jgi:hypothetical protein